MSPSRHWRINHYLEGVMFTAGGALTAEQVRYLARAESLRVENGMANAERDISTAVPLSVEGLTEGMAALLRGG